MWRSHSCLPVLLLQDFTGVPAVADLAAMRDAMKELGGDARKINPLQPAELVIDHSVQVDEYGSAAAFLINADKEMERNRERYAFLRWGQNAFQNFRVVPPDTGIVHQVNLEYLARVVMIGSGADGEKWAYPDTLVGTDSHTTMINGLGVLGWGVGGIEAEAAMLGQPVSMLVPQVVGFRLVGELKEGTTATDLVLTVTEQLRAHGVVGKFVEFFGPSLAALSVADRATLANMAPEYGATCGIFPVDDATLQYLRLTSRPAEQISAIEAYTKEQGLFHSADSPQADYTSVLELDLGSVVPSLAGPRRPQDRISLTDVKPAFNRDLPGLKGAAPSAPQGGGVAVAAEVERPQVLTSLGGEEFTLTHGSVVIAAITSCTNTSNPSVMVAAGLVAKKAVELGLETRPWVKTSLAPGSKVVTDYLRESGLTPYLDKLGFNLVGYGCTTCIGNSGPLREEISEAVREGDLVAVSVLSGNRNFEGRISPDVRSQLSRLAALGRCLCARRIRRHRSPPRSVGSGGGWNSDLPTRHLATGREIADTVARVLHSDMFHKQYSDVFAGDESWNELEVPRATTIDGKTTRPMCASRLSLAACRRSRGL